jgi:PAS domain S-box-containing protein
MRCCKRSFIVFALMGVLLSLPLCASAASLVAGVLKNFPPGYQLNDQGEPVGLAIDIFEALSQRTGHEIEYRVYDSWPELQSALKARQIDLVPNMGIADLRSEWAEFSLPVETFPVSLFVRRQTVDIDSLADFERRPLGVVEANIGVQLVAANPQLQDRTFIDVDSALLALLAGTIDGLIYPRPTLEKLARDARLADKIKALPTPLLEIKRGIAVPKGDFALLEEFNAQIPQFLQSQDYHDIYLRWYGESEPAWSHEELLTLFGVLLGAVVLLMAGWRYLSVKRLNQQLNLAKDSLEQEVATRTRELTVSKEKYRALYENAPLAYQSLDSDGNFIDVNPQWLRWLGYERDEIIGSCFAEFLHPDWQEVFTSNFPVFKKRGYISGVEFRIRHKNGYYLDIAFEGCVGYDPDGSFRQTYCVFQDISARKQEELRREQLEAQLRQKYKMEAVGHLAGGMAHNFNNNLSIILGNLELAMGAADDCAARLSYLEKAKTSVLRSRDLIQQILTYSREGMAEQEVGGVNISAVIGETLSLLESTIPATVRLNYYAAPDVEKLVVLASATELQEALLNLCTNAVHAMDESGELTISLIKTELQKEEIPCQYPARPGRFACLSVADTGCGMDSDIMEKIFDPFFSTKEVNKGTGMGLSTVQGMIKKYGGLVRVDSSPDKGTRFEMLFPLTELALEDEAAAAEEPIPLGRERILLVDDDVALVGLVAEMLESLGYRVTAASSAAQALEIFRANRGGFDLVMSDQTMPFMTGAELLAEIKQEDPALLTVLCTGYSRKIDSKQAAEQGIDLFMMKPLELDSMARRLGELFNRSALPS